MPPLVCFSANVIDHSLPRSNRDLDLVQKTLSSLTLAAEREECVILLTDALANFILGLEWTFCWEVIAKYPKVEIIYRLLAELGVQQHGVMRVNVEKISASHPHPLPNGI